MTHGYELVIERRIRLWMVQQERNRRRSAQRARGRMQAAPVLRTDRAIDAARR